MSDQPIFETDYIIIRRELHDDGSPSDQVRVEWNDDLAIVVGLGMLDLAKSTMLDTNMGKAEGDD